MKNDYRKKIAGYTGLAGSIIALCSHANAQIIYLDPPDIFGIVGDPLFLDLNSDGKEDCIITLINSYPNPGGKIEMNVDEGFEGHTCCSCGTAAYSVSALDTLEIISGTWADGVADYLCNLDGNSCGIEWVGANDKYIGLAIEDLWNNTNYAWVRLSVGILCEMFVIKDWAYNSQPNTPILAGQKDLATSAGINSISNDKIKIYAGGNVLFLKDNFEKQKLNLSVVNELGEIQFKTQTDNISASFNLNNLSSGFYFVMAKNPFQSVIEKVFIE